MISLPNIHDMRLGSSPSSAMELNMRRLEETEGIRTNMSEQEKQDIRNAAQEFEAFFLNMLMREMRRTVPESEGFFEKSNAERIFTEMWDEEVTKEMARVGGIGLADMIVRQLTMDYSNKVPRQLDIVPRRG